MISNTKPRLAVLILSWLRLDELLKTLRQIPNTCEEPLHLVLRVQGSERLKEADKLSVHEAARGFLTTDIYFTRDNVGAAAGRLDLVHRAARGSYEYMLFTDNDIYFPPSAIDKQAAFLDENPEAGAISLCPDRNKRLWMSVSDKYKRIPTDQITDSICEVISAASATFMFRSEIYTKHLIAPDSSYFIGGWDFDFAYQIYQVGYKLYVFTDLELINRRGGPPEYRKVRRNVAYDTENIALFRLKWGHSFYDRVLERG